MDVLIDRNKLRSMNEELAALRSENERLQKVVDEAIEKTYWVAHDDGRIWGKKAITREEITNCRMKIEGIKLHFRLAANPEKEVE